MPADNSLNDLSGVIFPSTADPQRRNPESRSGACILSVDVANLAEPVNDQPPVLQGKDLIVTITVRSRQSERPNIGFMIEQSKGVGITSLGTHEEESLRVKLNQMFGNRFSHFQIFLCILATM